ncbi:MAG: gamma carbonic anhydrase family protein [Opitutales bacterium]|nr:gamma carbonic anhydrase family protein [Opitutales bacterium]
MTTKERLDKYFASSPRIHPDAYVSPHAVIIGDVKVGAKSSIWPGVVMRADINSIEVGECSNVQDGTMVHLADDYGVKIGDYTTVGHGAILHACEIGNETLIGMGATVLDGAKVGNQCVIGACALVTKGTVIPDGSVVMGVPAKVVKTMDLKARSKIRDWAVKYLEVAQAHKEYFQDMGFACCDTPAEYADKCFARGEDVPEFEHHSCCGGHGEHKCHCHGGDESSECSCHNGDCDGSHHAKGECKCKKEGKPGKKASKKSVKKPAKSTKK